LLYARDRDQKNELAYNEFEYKRTWILLNYKISSLKKANFQSHMGEIAFKKTARSTCTTFKKAINSIFCGTLVCRGTPIGNHCFKLSRAGGIVM
jgi:hypothetical protein